MSIKWVSRETVRYEHTDKVEEIANCLILRVDYVSREGCKPVSDTQAGGLMPRQTARSIVTRRQGVCVCVCVCLCVHV